MIFLFIFFTSLLITLWRNNEPDAAAPYVCELFRIDPVSFRPHMTCKYQIDPQEKGLNIRLPDVGGPEQSLQSFMQQLLPPLEELPCPASSERSRVMLNHFGQSLSLQRNVRRFHFSNFPLCSFKLHTVPPLLVL